MHDAQKTLEERKITIISVINVLFALVLKSVIFYYSRSLILYGELVDSISDITVVTITFISLRESSKPSDLRHMFGHYKINSFAAFVQGCLLAILYGFVFYASLEQLISRPQQSPERAEYALGAIAIITVVALLSSKYVIDIGKKQKNLLIIAQGENFRGDFYRNVAQIIGLSLIAFGLGILDPILALFFSVRSIIVGVKIIKQSFYELTDSSTVSEDDIEKLEHAIIECCIPTFHKLKVRTVGQHLDIFVDFISEGRAESIHKSTFAKLKEVAKDMFPDYQANIIINYSEIQQRNYDNLEKTIDAIREIAVKNQERFDLHDISIDTFTDEVLVKVHVNINPSYSLTQAYDLSKIIKQEIIDVVKSNFQVEKIEVVRKIEPKHEERKQHTHEFDRATSDSVKSLVSQILANHEEILGIRKINAQIEHEGVYLVVKIFLDPKLNVVQTHKITEKIETEMRYAIDNLLDCTIQAQPKN